MRVGRYRVLSRLGSGGAGRVYRARDLVCLRDVALKLMHANRDERVQLARLRREVELLGRLSHPAIVPVLDSGTAMTDAGPTHYLVMPLISGDNLRRSLAGLDAAQRLLVMRRVTEAVAHAHAQGVIHRDIKPSNILLPDPAEPMVTDFDLARLGASPGTITREGAIVGTPCFMPPEQALGQNERVGPHSDVWSLGVLLCLLLTGELPFRGRTIGELFASLLRRKPILADHRVPPALRRVCVRALAKEPGRRYADAQEMAAALERATLGLRGRLARMLARGPSRR